MKKKRTLEHNQNRASERWHTEEYKRKKARRLAEKMMGKNYFSNMQEMMLKAAIEMSERRHDDKK